MWSLAIEEQFYLGFPLLILWARNKRRLYAALTAHRCPGHCCALIELVEAFHLGFLARDMNSWCFDTLALGALCALLGDRLPHGRRVASACVLAGIVLIGFAFYRGGVAPLIVGACLFVHGADHVDLFSAKIWLVPARAGQLSYGMYLLQATAIYLVSPWLPQLSFGVGFGLIIAVTYIAAELSYQDLRSADERLIHAADTHSSKIRNFSDLFGGDRRDAFGRRWRSALPCAHARQGDVDAVALSLTIEPHLAAASSDLMSELLRPDPEFQQLGQVIGTLEGEAGAVVFNAQDHRATAHMDAQPHQRRPGAMGGVDGTFVQHRMDAGGQLGRQTIGRFAIGEIEGQGQREIAFQLLLQHGETKGKAGHAEACEFGRKTGGAVRERFDTPNIHRLELDPGPLKDWLMTNQPSGPGIGSAKIIAGDVSNPVEIDRARASWG